MRTRKQIKLSKESLEDLYLAKHFTGQEIADMLGVTRQGVYKAMNRLGIDRSAAERFKATCDHCGGLYELTRGRYNSSDAHYCSEDCYHGHRAAVLPNRTKNRQGQRIARAVMEKHINRALKGTECVHHVDGDQTNNHIDNLMLFMSHSEHLRYHHQLRIAQLHH